MKHLLRVRLPLRNTERAWSFTERRDGDTVDDAVARRGGTARAAAGAEQGGEGDSSGSGGWRHQHHRPELVFVQTGRCILLGKLRHPRLHLRRGHAWSAG